MKTIFTLFAAKVPIRVNRKQKLKALNLITGYCEKSGWNWFLNEDKSNNKILKKKALNFFVGDIKKAKAIIVTGYDTPIKALSKNYKYYPLDAFENHSQEFIDLIFRISISAVIIVCFFVFLFLKNILSINIVLKYIIFALVVLLSIIFAKGIPNKNNYNRNTSAIAVMVDMILNIKLNDNLAFCFLDKQAEDSLGFESLGKILEKINPDCEVVILDAVANGKTLYYAKTKGIHNISFCDNRICEVQLSREEIKRNPLFFFKKAIMITRGSISANGIVVNNTRTSKDNKIDLNKLETVERILLEVMRKSNII